MTEKRNGNNKKNIWSASEVQSDNSAVVSDGLQSEPIAENDSTSNGTPSNISTDKDTTSSLNNNNLQQKIAQAEAEVNTNPTEAQKEAGTKHSIFRHYNTDSGVINADDILLIPDVIANGTRTVKNNGKIEYKYSHNNGTKYTVLTEKNNRGAEVFADFYTN